MDSIIDVMQALIILLLVLGFYVDWKLKCMKKKHEEIRRGNELLRALMGICSISTTRKQILETLDGLEWINQREAIRKQINERGVEDDEVVEWSFEWNPRG